MAGIVAVALQTTITNVHQHPDLNTGGGGILDAHSCVQVVSPHITSTRCS